MKKGQTVVKILSVGGVESAVIGKISAATKTHVVFGNDSHLRYDHSGREIDPAPGFVVAGISSRLVALDGE